MNPAPDASPAPPADQRAQSPGPLTEKITPVAPSGLARFFSGTRSSMLLLTMSALWLAVTLWASSRVPGPGIGASLVVGVGFLLMLVLWLAAAFYAWAFRRRLGIAAWVSVPAVTLIVFLLPWQSWFWSAKIRSARPALSEITQKYAYLPEGQPRELEPAAIAGAFTITRITRYKSGTALALVDSKNSELGLFLAIAGTQEVPIPTGARSHNAESIAAGDDGGTWWRYSWRLD